MNGNTSTAPGYFVDVSLKAMDHETIRRNMRLKAIEALRHAQENSRDLTLLRSTFPDAPVIGVPRPSERCAHNVAVRLHDYIRGRERGDCLMICGSGVEPRIIVTMKDQTALYKGADGINDFLNDYQEFVK